MTIFAKTSLILTLVLGLLFTAVARSLVQPVEMSKGDCAKMECVTGCCSDKACCAAMQQQRAPQPIQGTPRSDLQLAPIGLRDLAPLYFLPPALRSFVIRDDAHAWHTPPLLAVICVRLI